MSDLIDLATSTEPPDFYDLGEVARRMGIARRTVVDHVKAGTFPLPVLQVGRRKVVGRIAFERAMAGGFTERAS